MYYNQPMYQQPAMPMMGGAMNYNGNYQMPKFTNPLGDAKIKQMLENGAGAPKLVVTEEDFNQAVCTHRWQGQMQTYDIGDGKVKCRICGAEFHPVDDASDEDIKRATENLHDILHTAKLMWLDVPDQVAMENFQVLAITDQVPKIFSIAADRCKKYGNFNLASATGNMNGFGMMQQLMGPMMGGMAQPMMANPMMAQPMMGQPMMGQPGQPMMANPMMGQQQPMMQQPMMGAYDPNMAAMAQQQQMMMTPMQQQMTQNATGVGVTNGFGFTQPQQQPAVNTQAVNNAVVTPVDAGQSANVQQTLHV